MKVPYPCNMPGVHVNSNGVTPQELTRQNGRVSGPPIFRLLSEDGWLQFDVVWRFNNYQTQVFKNWHKVSLSRGSKSALIALKVPDGLIEHECYFVGTPRFNQSSNRWIVSATLLAIADAGLNDCDAESLININNGFELPWAAPEQLNDVIETLEALWLP